MMSKQVYVCLLLLLLSLSPLSQAMAATGCPTAGSVGAKVMQFAADDVETRDGLSASLAMGLSPASYPFVDVSKMKSPCKRTTFVVGGETYTLYGKDDEEGPPRYAIGPNPNRIAYVALLPFPRPALGAVQSRPHASHYNFKRTEFMYVLAITDGDQRQIYKFYDSLPTDDRVSEDMCAALVGEDPVIGTYFSIYGMSDLSRLGAPKNPVAHSKCRGTIS